MSESYPAEHHARRMEHHRFLSTHKLWIIILCLVATLSWGDTVSARSHRLVNSLLSRGGDNNPYHGEETTGQKKWSSFFTVDPSKILSVLVKRGGLLIPKSAEKELLALASVLHVDEASLNLVERQLVVRNFTVNVPGSSQYSLYVGRMHMRWDSYTKPCVDIEVEDVRFLFEFTNLMLTRSNWNELEDAGFPPTMEEFYDASTPSSTFVRIGSIALSGKVTAEIRSRPLDRAIANMTFDLASLDDLSTKIRRLSEINQSATGRRGCTTDEVYSILHSYFIGKMRKFLKDTAFDLSAGPFKEEGSSTVREARKFLYTASDLVKSYAGDAGRKTGDDMQESIARRLEKLGVSSPREKLSSLRELTSNAARNVDARNLVGAQLKRLQETYQRQREVALTDETIIYKTRFAVGKECQGKDTSERSTDVVDCDDIKDTVMIFPDW